MHTSDGRLSLFSLALLFKDDRVQDAAVVGTTDPADGSERPWAFVVSRDPLSEDSKKNDEKAQSILERVNRQVAGYKKIAGLTWLDALPKRYACSFLTLSSTLSNRFLMTLFQ